MTNSKQNKKEFHHVTVFVTKNREGKSEKVCFTYQGDVLQQKKEIEKRFKGCQGLNIKVW